MSGVEVEVVIVAVVPGLLTVKVKRTPAKVTSPQGEQKRKRQGVGPRRRPVGRGLSTFPRTPRINQEEAHDGATDRSVGPDALCRRDRDRADTDPRKEVDVTGAWDVTITMASGSVSGLAILSQDGSKVTGMMGPALTDMFPVEGTWDGDKLTISARPRAGRTTAFAKCELTGTRERMVGTSNPQRDGGVHPQE